MTEDVKIEYRAKGKVAGLAAMTSEQANEQYLSWLNSSGVFESLESLRRPMSVEQLRDYVVRTMADPSNCFFAVHLLETDKFVGTIKISGIEPTAGIGYVGLVVGDRAARGLGVGKEIVGLVTEYAFHHLNLRKLCAGVADSNTASLQCFLSNGYFEEARRRDQLFLNGEYRAQILVAKFRDE